MTERQYQDWLSDQLDQKRSQIEKRENELEILTNSLERDRQKERYLRKKCDRARTHRLIQYGAAFESRRPEKACGFSSSRRSFGPCPAQGPRAARTPRAACRKKA